MRAQRRLPLGPELRNLNGWQFRALLTEGGAERLELARAQHQESWAFSWRFLRLDRIDAHPSLQSTLSFLVAGNGVPHSSQIRIWALFVTYKNLCYRLVDTGLGAAGVEPAAAFSFAQER